jgi:ZPR1-related zinc finger protein
MSEKAKKSTEDYSFKCPACKKGNLVISKTIYQLPDEDKMLIIKFECNNCKFNKNDIIPLTTRISPGIMTLKISSEEDLKSKIYRSPVGKLEIPELELIVEPGPSADFYYTNVEGILYRFEKAVSIFYNSLDKQDAQLPEIEEILKNLEKAINGKFEFTLIITDFEGGSYIIPEDKSKYSFEEIKNAKS